MKSEFQKYSSHLSILSIPQSVKCMCHPWCWRLCDSFPANLVFHCYYYKTFSISRNDLCADCQKEAFFLQLHWLVFSNTVLTLHLAVIPWAPKQCCLEQSNPQDVLHKQLVGVLLLLSPAVAVAAAFHDAALVTAVVLALQGSPGFPRLSTVRAGLSCQLMDHGILWGFLTLSPNRPKGKKSKGRKLWCSSISSLILCHSVKKLLRLQVGQQYRLFHSIRTVLLSSLTHVCVPR